jgi:hypothetical protein
LSRTLSTERLGNASFSFRHTQKSRLRVSCLPCPVCRDACPVYPCVSCLPRCVSCLPMRVLSAAMRVLSARPVCPRVSCLPRCVPCLPRCVSCLPNNFARCIAQHTGNMLQPGSTITYLPMTGSSPLQRQVAEQLQIIQAGGVKMLNNQRNAIGMARAYALPVWARLFLGY